MSCIETRAGCGAVVILTTTISELSGPEFTKYVRLIDVEIQ
jgi:hypothetical protein